MTLSEARELVAKLEAFFEIEMPSLVNYPESFKYYLRVYRFYNSS